MNNALFVGVRYRASQFFQDQSRLPFAQHKVFSKLRQRWAVDELHHDSTLVSKRYNLEDGDDVRMCQTSQGRSFLLQSTNQFSRPADQPAVA